RGAWPKYVPECAGSPRNIDCASPNSGERERAIIKPAIREALMERFLLRAPHHERQFEWALSKSAVDFPGPAVKTAFISDPELVRLEREKITFLRHQTYRDVVCLLADDDEFDAGSVHAAIRKLHRDVTRVSL